MELKHFKCPSCGANLKTVSNAVELKCEYCGQHFVVDAPNAMTDEAINETITEIINEKLEETNKQHKSNKVKTVFIIGIAALVGIISLAMIILAIVSPDVLANT